MSTLMLRRERGRGHEDPHRAQTWVAMRSPLCHGRPSLLGDTSDVLRQVAREERDHLMMSSLMDKSRSLTSFRSRPSTWTAAEPHTSTARQSYFRQQPARQPTFRALNSNNSGSKSAKPTGSRLQNRLHTDSRIYRFIRSQLQPGEWATSIDLSDAYLHIPVAIEYQKFLCIHIHGKSYQFRTMCLNMARGYSPNC